MGLKAIMKANEQTEQEIQKLKSKLTTEELQTQNLIFQTQELQLQTQEIQSTILIQSSTIQELQSKLTIAKEQIETLTSRASIVSKTELENKELLKLTQNALVMSDNAKNDAEQEYNHARIESEKAKKALIHAKAESREKTKAQEEARESKRDLNYSKMTYKSLFISQSIFTLVLAFFLAYSKYEVLVDMLEWFPLRFNNIKSFIACIITKYMEAIQFVSDKWELKSIWNYIIVSTISLVIAIFLFFIAYLLVMTIKEFLIAIYDNCYDRLFKQMISFVIALTMLFSCIFFYEPITSIISLNIFSVWLIFSLIGILLHIPEIIEIYN